MCSICLPQCGQALRPMSVSHTRHSPFQVCPQHAWPSGHASKSLHSQCQSAKRTLLQAAKLVIRGLNGQMPEYATTAWNGGARRDRTDDLKLAKLPLSQLSYGPVSPTSSEAGSPGPSLNLVGLGRLELPTSRLSSARSNQLSYRPSTPRLRAIPPSAPFVATSRERETWAAHVSQMNP